jgi:lipopolysaccharide export system permease protein
MMQFERYGLLVAPQSAVAAGDKSARALPTMRLITEPTSFNLGELLWRCALPVMCLTLMLLAIPLGFVNPRGGRSANLLVALFLFVVYSNTVSIFQAAVVQKRMSLMEAMWPAHAVAALIVIGFFLWRINVNSPRHPLVWYGRCKRALLHKRREQA